MSVFEVAYQICTPAVSGCLRALWLCVRVDFLWDLWWLAEATQTWPHLQRFYGTRCLRLWSPLFLAVVLRFHALPQRFSGCYSQFGLQCEDFLSFTRPFTSFPDSFFFFFNSKNFQSFSSFSVSPAPLPFFSLSAKFLSTFPRFLFSFSLTLSGERSYSAAPGFLWFPCQQVVRQRQEQGAKGERQSDRMREREREAFTGFTELLLYRRAQRQYLAPLQNGTAQNRNTSQQNTKQLLRLDNIHTV